MTPLRARLAASTAIAALLVALAGPLFASEPSHLMCAARNHDCGKTPRLAHCCCSEPANGSTPPGPLPVKFTVSQSAALTTIPVDLFAPLVATTTCRWPNAPPGPELRDLTTLFGALLI